MFLRKRPQAILPKIPLPKDQIIRLEIRIEDIMPPIYRKIDIPNTYTFYQLHHVIQLAFDWTNSHLFEFMNGPETIGDEEAKIDAKKLTLKERFYEPKQKMLYVYDFGDNWEHKVKVEKMFDADPKKRYPACVSGRRAGPPEDVGGVGGYEHFLEAIADDEHPDHEEYLEWLGGYFDSEAFSRKEVNALLRDYADGKLNPDQGWEE
jgi:hypothetical protein